MKKHSRFARITAYIRGLIHGSGAPKKTSDFGAVLKPTTVMLRERTWRIELSHSGARRFFRRHRLAIIGVMALLVAGIFVRYALVGFASTADFYPSSCLGNWDNVQNALGKPDLASGAPASSFTTLNSAVFSSSTEQMFCGNFTGDTDISILNGKSFQGADLVLSWSFESPDGGGGGGPTLGTVPTVPAVTDTSTATTTATDTDMGVATDSVSSDDTSTDASDTDAAAATSSATTTTPVVPASTSTSSSTPDDDTSSSASTSVTTAPTDTSTVSTTNTTTTDDSDSTTTPPPASTSTPAPTPPPTPPPATTTTPAPTPDESASDSTPTSWLIKFFNTAYADDISSATAGVATSGDTTTMTSTTPLTVASSAQQATPTVPQPAPINVNTSMFQNIILPSSTGDSVLAIVYSTDGVTWQPLANVDASNWQQERYPIPINSWDELQHLQVAFVGLGASSSPQVFLDAAAVEVSYVDAPQADDITPITPDTGEQDDSAGTTASSTWIPPQAYVQAPTVAPTDVFDQGAHQKCVVTPFSQTVEPGDYADFSIELSSGLMASSTEQPVYQVRTGSLPMGVSAVMTDGPVSQTSSTKDLRINISPTALTGSYSMIVVYRERQDDASMRSTGCQMNVIIK